MVPQTDITATQAEIDNTLDSIEEAQQYIDHAWAYIEQKQAQLDAELDAQRQQRTVTNIEKTLVKGLYRMVETADVVFDGTTRLTIVERDGKTCGKLTDTSTGFQKIYCRDERLVGALLHDRFSGLRRQLALLSVR